VIKVFNSKNLGSIINYPIEVVNNIKEVLVILNENY